MNYNIRQQEGPGESSVYQEVYREDTTFITEQASQRLRGGLSQTVRLGADYFFNPKNTLTTSFSYKISDDMNFAETEYNDYINNLDHLVERSIRTDDEDEFEHKLEYAIDYEKKFDREGQSWKTRISYQDNVEEEGSILENRFLDGILFLEQKSNNKERENTLIFQSDYVIPFSKDKKFEVGGRASIRNIDNDYLVQELRDDVWVPLEGLNNDFQYDEKIYAAYVIYGDKMNQFSYQVGLRPEYTDVNTALLTTDEVNPRSYINLFPSAFLAYEFGKNNTLQLSYSRRVRRPRFWDLNPFFTFSDNRNFFSGNPDLDPEFTDALELGHLKFWDKASLSSAIYYRYTTGVIQRIRVVNSDGTSVTKPQNLNTRNSYGLEFNGNYNPAKWFRFSSEFNFFRSITNGENIDEDLVADAFSWNNRSTVRLKFWKKLDTQFRFNYRAAQNTTQGSRLPFYTMDIAASSDFLKDKATITLSARDIFNSRRRRYTTEGDDFFREGDFQWRARQVTLSLSYRLNQRKQRGGRRGGDDGGGEGQF